jgi:hypothetical protein
VNYQCGTIRIALMSTAKNIHAKGFASRPSRVESVSEFLNRVNELTSNWHKQPEPFGPWFRGQQRSYWRLRPKLYREYGNYREIKKDNIESEIREEFVVRAPVLSETKPAGDDEWEWYFLMLHFGTPTRLLDWTEGALIALYFAVRDNFGYYDAAVWALDPYELNWQTIQRDEVIPPSAAGVTSSDRKLVKPWLPAVFSRRTRLPRAPIAVVPTHIARRISTQRSCFTVHGIDEDGVDKLQEIKNGPLLKIVIPAFKVQSIRRELERCGIDEITIFPDLDGLSRSVAARWRSDSHKPPHDRVYTRLRPSKIHGVGVFAIKRIKKGMPIFPGENEEMLWVERAKNVQSSEIQKLYDDFAIIQGKRLGCPQNFNRLTMAWYLNEPKRGDRPNVRCDNDTYDFFALRDIKADEELTVDYSAFSDKP